MVLGIPALVVGLPNNLSPFVEAGALAGRPPRRRAERGAVAVCSGTRPGAGRLLDRRGRSPSIGPALGRPGRRPRRRRPSPTSVREGGPGSRSRGPEHGLAARRAHGIIEDSRRRSGSGETELSPTMRVLITGGAGFVGSHLADAAPRTGRRGLRARQPLHRLDRQHRAPQEPPALPLHHRLGRQRAAPRRADRPRRRRRPPRRRRRREEDRRRAGPHHREQRPRHRGRAPARQQEEEAGRRRLDLRGLRQEPRRAVPRGRRPGDGPDPEAPLGLCLQQGDRRVPGAGLLEGKEAAGDHHPALQHRRPAPDRPVRDGDPELRAAGAGQPADHRVRRRHADAAASPTSATSSTAWCG